MRSKWLQQKTRASQELYKKRRTEANVLIKQKKKAWMNNKILQIEYNQKRNDTRKFFQEIKTFKPQQTILPTICKHSSGNTISQIDDVLERWKEYFQNLLSIPIVPERPQLISEGSSKLGVCREASSLTQENCLLKKLDKETPDR